MDDITLKLPAYPQPIVSNEHGEKTTTFYYDHRMAGFTKLELASLMALQGLLARSTQLPNDEKQIAEAAVQLAKAVLEEANK